MPPIRAALQAFAVALVLADSAAVTLALPEILGAFDASVSGVSWVLVSSNLAPAAAAGSSCATTSASGRALEAGIDRARSEDAVGALEAAALRFAVRRPPRGRAARRPARLT